MAKALLATFLLFANLVLARESLAEEKPPCGPYAAMNASLEQMGFSLVYMSADSELKTGTRFYINADQKAIAVLIVEIADKEPSACIAALQGNLYVKKDVLERLHNKLIGEKT